MADNSNVFENKPIRRMQVYPTLDHFRRASQSGWMRPFDLAEYEAYLNAESEPPAHPFVPAGMREPGIARVNKRMPEQIVSLLQQIEDPLVYRSRRILVAAHHHQRRKNGRQNHPRASGGSRGKWSMMKSWVSLAFRNPEIHAAKPRANQKGVADHPHSGSLIKAK